MVISEENMWTILQCPVVGMNHVSVRRHGWRFTIIHTRNCSIKKRTVFNSTVMSETERGIFLLENELL